MKDSLKQFFRMSLERTKKSSNKKKSLFINLNEEYYQNTMKECIVNE